MHEKWKKIKIKIKLKIKYDQTNLILIFSYYGLFKKGLKIRLLTRFEMG
jgi:hypothetical protein